MTKPILFNFTDAELTDFVIQSGQPKFRAKQIREWLMRGAPDFASMKNLPEILRNDLDKSAQTLPVKIVKKLQSADGETTKFLLELFDGEQIECVLMRTTYGNSVCVSSQAGCAMGCKFCASTLLGRTRDLYPSEMLGQIIAAEKDTNERVSNVVMMGIGEPLDNYDNTIKFLKLVSSDDGLNIGLRHISVSTCGLVDKIERLSQENLPVTLSISLHAYDNSVRDEIMPVNKKYPIEVLLDACQKYFEKTSRRISFEYTLIAGKNDTVEGACRLAALIKKHINSPCHVNLIPLNEVKETKLETSKNVFNFKNKLLSLGINATVRRRLGSDINASCGQLRKGAKEVNQ